ncbi:MAG: NADH-quinone oxidoreductase subunit J [Pseudomonadota bacterium]
MLWASIFFYIFAFVLITSAFMVISARNPVHAVLFLILAFFNAGGLFLLLGAEFLALMLIIVYVGAVAVLFLFVVMMLDVDFAELRAGFTKYMPVGAFIGILLVVELALIITQWRFNPPSTNVQSAQSASDITNTEAIGRVLYTDYVYAFEIAGLILLVAMIGAIVLTLRQKEGVKRQDVAAQVARRPEDGVEICQVEPGSGL